MWIMVSGPYRTGSHDPAVHAANLRALNQAAVALFRRGHVPVIAVNLVLPLIETAAGADFDEMMMTLSLALAQRCDACLRIGGASLGADQEVAFFRAQQRPVYFSIHEIPPG